MFQATNTHDELGTRLNQFAEAYNTFIAAYKEDRFDLRAAKRLSSLWKAVEQSGMWPKLVK